MNLEQFRQVLLQLEGKTNFIYYHLMGEPLTHPLLPDFLSMAQAQGFRSVITTNGTLLRRRQEVLLGSPIHKFNISLHSFEEGSEDSFHRYIEDVANFSKAATARGIIVSLRLWNQGHDKGRNDQILSLLKQWLPEPWTTNSRGLRLADKLFLEWGERFSWPDAAAPVLGSDVYCYGMGDHFGILCDGTVVPCCLDSEGAIPLGNVFRENLTEILSSPRATAMVEGFRCRNVTEDLCRRCGYARKF
jgi:MoaA/NifB/PqqE/SkfB family radical SAM enzyme